MNQEIKIERPAPGGNPRMGWASDVAAEMLRRLGIRYVTHNPGSSFAGLHNSIVNYLGNQDPTMLLCLNEGAAVAITFYSIYSAAARRQDANLPFGV